MIFLKKFTFIKLASLSLVSIFFVILTQSKASAEVNVNVLNSVIKSCQENPPKDNLLFKLNSFDSPGFRNQNCVSSRYYYTLFLSRFKELKNLGDLRPGFPASVLLAVMTGHKGGSSETLLDCMVSKNSYSRECHLLNQKYWSVDGVRLMNSALDAALICSSCFNAYNTGSKLQKSIFDDFISWFYSLDKPSRKLVVDSFSDKQLTQSLYNESREASQLYLKIKEKVEREDQEQKRRELLQ